MVNHSCFTTTKTDTNNYSSPVPYVGFYIAAASLVCFFLIICDVWIGFRRRKLWFPCRFFALNSVTLILVSIASKIPVDLTTDMPSAVDQLSKLSGTVFICVAMGFMIPSIGINGTTDSYANVTAMSMFVITVVVNICIQIATGVIFAFIVEHSAVMLCMLLMLIRFWIGVFEINAYKIDSKNINNDLIQTGQPSMMQRLKVCFVHAYNTYPQFLLSCKSCCSGHVSLVCTTCCLLLSEAMLRSFVFRHLEFCKRVSDYGWSMWLILVTQFLMVVVASLALGFRWLSSAEFLRNSPSLIIVYDNYGANKFIISPYKQLIYMFSLKRIPKVLQLCFEIGVTPVVTIDAVILILSRLVLQAITLCRCRVTQVEIMEEFRCLLEAKKVQVQEWVFRKAVNDMDRIIEEKKKGCSDQLIQLLREVPPSQKSLPNTDISCLSVVLLVEIAKLVTPTPFHVSLKKILDEVFEAMHFIDRTVGGSRNKLRSMYTHILWNGSLPIIVDKLVKEKFLKKIKERIAQSQLLESCDYQSMIIREFPRLFYPPIIRDEARTVVNLVLQQRCGTRKEVCDHIKQLFVDMLHAVLSQIPDAIFQHILESPEEEYEDRVRYGLGLACKFEWLESHMGLAFPTGSDITTLVATRVSATNPPAEGNFNGLTISHTIEHATEIHEIGQNGTLEV